MKGQFSIEWLSQSSQITCSPKRAAGSWMSTPSDGPGTSGTDPQSLPGHCSRWRQHHPNYPQGADATPVVAAGGPSAASKQDAAPEDQTSLQHNTHGSEAGFNSGTEEETSGYESEGGRSLSPVASKVTAPSTSPSAGRRPRTAFTAEQINSLEKAFNRNAYLGTQDKAELCKRLSLSDKQIRNWFQNRRMKLKRTVQDALAHACQAKVASHLMPYPDLQAFRAAPYPSYYQQENPSHYICPTTLHYNPTTAGGVPPVPMDPIFQYGSLQGLATPPTNPTLMAQYQHYHGQYFSTQ